VLCISEYQDAGFIWLKDVFFASSSNSGVACETVLADVPVVKQTGWPVSASMTKKV
jgi:hypothetical protein